MANKCQFPLWGNELPPTDELLHGEHYCNEPAPRGKSYCDTHAAMCSQKINLDAPKVRWSWSGKKSTITNSARFD